MNQELRRKIEKFLDGKPVPTHENRYPKVITDDFNLFNDIVDDLLRLKYNLDPETDPPIQVKTVNLETHDWLPYEPEPRIINGAEQASDATNWALINLSIAAQRVKTAASVLRAIHRMPRKDA